MTWLRDMTRLRGGMVALAAAVSITGCNMAAGGAGSTGSGTGPGSEPENTDPPVDALEMAGHPGLETCSSGMTEAEIEGALQIARDFRSSCHEMVVCGGLNASFSFSLVSVLFNAAAGDPTEPSGFTYEGDGWWRSGDVMRVRLHLPEDTSFGAAGDPITFDLFDPNNYFVGFTLEASASVDLSGETQSRLSVQFEGAGPGAELLGLAPDASGSIELDFDEVVAQIGRVELRNDITVDDEHGDTHVIYTLRGSPVPIADLSGDGSQGQELVGVTATNEVTGQTIEITDWGMDYRSGVARTLDGTISFDVVGGSLPYSATFVYPHRSSPDVTLRCP